MAKEPNKAELTRRARELRALLSELVDELKQPGLPRYVQPKASAIFEKARSLERAAMQFERKHQNERTP